MGVGGGDDVGASFVNAGVDGEGCGVDFAIPFDDFALIVDKQKIRDTNLAEMDPKRVDPEMVEALGITSSDVSGDAFIEAAFREQSERASEPLLAVAALLGGGGKHRRARDAFQASFNLSHKVLP